MKDELSLLWEENKQALEKEKARLTSEKLAFDLINGRFTDHLLQHLTKG